MPSQIKNQAEEQAFTMESLIGREKVIKNLRMRGLAMVSCYLLIIGICIYVIWLYIKDIEHIDFSKGVVLLILGFFILVCSLGMTVGIDYLRGKKSKYVASRANYLQLADDLSGNH
ncbi:MAG: hypothetical protein K6G64_00265 [Eubacterium sp.]|nr:hypothetical protein [Eubacterium sp.]